MIGQLLQWIINAWVSVTGKVCGYDAYPWLRGPIADTDKIGDDYYNSFAASKGYRVDDTHEGGLLKDFGEVLNSDGDKLNARIRHFYEHTVQYKLEVWSQWYPPISFFARILIRTISTKMDQMNIPLEPLETSRGMTNAVIHIVNPADGKLQYACWLRKSILSGRVVYAGFYSACEIAGSKYVRVIFPLPKGNVTVLLKTEMQADGSVKLLSHGKGIGDAGYYRVRKHGEDAVKVKYIPLKESIHVFEDNEAVLRTDHIFWFLGMKMLHLHYKIIPR